MRSSDSLGICPIFCDRVLRVSRRTDQYESPAQLNLLSSFLSQDECEVSDLTPTLVVYQLLAGLLVAAIAVYFYKYRKVPDLVGIWAESLYACIFVFIMGAIYALLDTIDPGNIKSTVPVVFDWVRSSLV